MWNSLGRKEGREERKKEGVMLKATSDKKVLDRIRTAYCHHRVCFHQKTARLL